jgi:hypothetical protein
MRQAEQDMQNRTARKGLQDSSAKTKLSIQDCPSWLDRAAKISQLGIDRKDRTGRMGHTELYRQNWLGRTVKVEQ